MKKFYLILLTALMSLVASAERTVYFENTDNWGKVYAYAWTSGNDPYTGAWPGTEISTKSGDYYVAKITATDDAEVNIIFHNGSGSQTSDLKLEDNRIYDHSGYTNKSLINGEIEEGPYHYYLRGETPGWGTEAEAYRFKNVSGTSIYELTLPRLNKAKKFKIWKKEGNVWYSNADTQIEFEKDYTLGYENDNMELKEDGTNMTISFNVDTRVMKISATATADPSETVYLVGDFNADSDGNWILNDEKYLFTKESGESTLHLENVEGISSVHKFCLYNASTNKYWAFDEPIIFDKVYKISETDAAQHMHLAKGAAKSTFTYNFGTKKLIVTDQAPIVAERPAFGKYKIYFDNSYNWETPYVWVWDHNNDDNNYTGGEFPGTAMTKEADGTYSFEWTVASFVTNPGMKILFSNGKEGEEQEQTHNFVVENGRLYEASLNLIDVEVPADRTYNLYFDNYLYYWPNVYVYVWDHNNGDKLYTKAFPGTRLEKDENGYYTFACVADENTAHNPGLKVIFSDGSKSEPLEYRTHNLIAYDCGIYNGDVFTDEYFDPQNPSNAKAEEVTIYFASNDSWGDVNAYVWVKNTSDSYKGWNDAEAMTATGRQYRDADGNEYNVYSYTFPKKYTALIVKNNSQQTVDLDVVDGALYVPTTETDGGNFKTNKLNTWEYYTPADSYTATIYFNAGADFFNAKKMNRNHPTISLYMKGTDKLVEKEEMTLVTGRDALFYYVVDDAQNYDAVQFSAKNENDETIYWNGKAAEGFDKDNWDKFIYGTGEGKAFQSYMTFEDLEENRNNVKENIYFIGQNLSSSVANWNRSKLLSITDKDQNDDTDRGWMGEGVYVRNFNLSYVKDQQAAKDENNWIKFKMSSVNPKDYIEKYHAQDYELRWWATFNLAIVGYIPGTTGTAGMQGSQAGVLKNGMVHYNLNEIEQYSNYNQYDWTVTPPIAPEGFDFENASDDEKKVSYYLVIDTKYRTTALVDFKPQPTLTEAKLNNFSVDELSITGQEKTGKVLRGSAHSGEARLHHYNSMTASAQVVVSKGIRNTLYKERQIETENGTVPGRYKVIYGLYSNEEFVGGFYGIPEADGYRLTLNNLGSNDEPVLAIRCTYIEPEAAGGLCFRSLSETEEITSEAATFNKYGTPDVTSTLLWRDQNGWNMAVKFTAPHTPVTITKGDETVTLAMYPDFRSTNSKGCKVRALNTKDVENLKKYFTSDKIHFTGMHTAYTGGEYSHDTHNWSKNAKKDDQGDFELIIENIAPASVSAEQAKLTNIDFTILASYPFLVDSNNTPEVHAQTFDGTKYDDIADQAAIKLVAEIPAVPARVIRRANEGDARMTLVAQPTKVEGVTVDENGMSGIADAVIGAEDDAEYFTLQGIRVEGELTPGIYLRRSAGVAEKVVIR